MEEGVSKMTHTYEGIAFKYKDNTQLKVVQLYRSVTFNLNIGDIITVNTSKEFGGSYTIQKYNADITFWTMSFIENPDNFLKVGKITNWRKEFTVIPKCKHL